MDDQYWRNFLEGFVEGFIAGCKGFLGFWLKAIPVGFLLIGGIWSVFGFNLWTLILSHITVLVVWTKMWLNFEEPPND